MTTTPTDTTATSADGTRIAVTRQGSGPDLVMVHCVGTSRARTPEGDLPAALAEHFTVWTYDRRGTGTSADGAAPYAVEREFEDLTAVIDLAEGRPVTVYGFSSGATLALLAAAGGVRLERLALLEPPLLTEADPALALRDHAARLLAEEGPDAADHWYKVEVVGVPEEVMAQLPPRTDEDRRNTGTIVHELEFLPGTTADRFAGVEQPVLVVASDQTDPFIYACQDAIVDAVASAEKLVLPGEWHGVPPTDLARAIADFVART